jgi:cell division transport system permease protein
MIKSLFYSLKEAFKQMFRSKVMTLVSIFSISAMLLILGLFFFLTVNINFISENIKTQFDTIEVFLLDDTSKADADVIAMSLKTLDEVAGVEYISKEQAMEEFRAQWGDNGYLLDGLAENPLPNSLRVTLKDLKYGSFVAEFSRTMDGVEDVRYYQTEINKVLKISEAIQKGALVIIAFLVIVSVVVVSNTIKLTVMSRQDEIMIMKYVGATNWFVRGPLLVEGMLIGCFSALIALGLCWLVYDRIGTFFTDQALALFSSNLVEPEFMLQNLAWIFMSLGISIGAFGSLLSMRRYLKA